MVAVSRSIELFQEAAIFLCVPLKLTLLLYVSQRNNNLLSFSLISSSYLLFLLVISYLLSLYPIERVFIRNIALLHRVEEKDI